MIGVAQSDRNFAPLAGKFFLTLALGHGRLVTERALAPVQAVVVTAVLLTPLTSIARPASTLGMLPVLHVALAIVAVVRATDRIFTPYPIVTGTITRTGPVFRSVAKLTPATI